MMARRRTLNGNGPIAIALTVDDLFAKTKSKLFLDLLAYMLQKAPCAEMILKINEYFKTKGYTEEVGTHNTKNILVNILEKLTFKRSAEVGPYILKPE
jgi:hypothetical protein